MFGLGICLLKGPEWNTGGILFVIIFIVSFQLSWGPIPLLYFPEILQDKALSVAFTSMSLANVILTAISPTVFQAVSAVKQDDGTTKDLGGYLFVGTSVLNLCATAIAIFLMKETKGKTPLEISKMYNMEEDQ